MKKICKQCGKEFEITQSEIDFYKSRNLHIPKRCKSCRDANKRTSDESRQSYNHQTYSTPYESNNTPNMGRLYLFGALAIGIALIAAVIAIGSTIGYEPDSSSDIVSAYSQTESEVQYEPTPEIKLDSIEVTEAEISTAEDVSETASPEQIVDEITDDEQAPQLIEEESEPMPAVVPEPAFRFKNKQLLDEHYYKHGVEMGFSSPEEYEAAASNVITSPKVLQKTEADDGDYVYYLESTNEFVVVSTRGFIRTYFKPNDGIAYYNRQ